jgi:hypothetical protein
MPHFTKRLEVEKTFLNFYFNRIYTADGQRYYISVIGKDKKTYTFHMVEQGPAWKLLNPGNCPDWIVAVEKEISEHIKSHLAHKISNFNQF